jgi:uncharacterized protein with PIN domain
MKFIADVMLGKLARGCACWVLTYLFKQLEDDEILRIAESDDRIILTRDVPFAAKAQAATMRAH